jgi:hypothetical protein
VVCWGLSLSPPKLVGIFGTVGTYGLLAASLPAIVFGVLRDTPPPGWTIVVSSVLALVVHFGLYLGLTDNTGLTATIALAVAMPLPLVLEAITSRKETRHEQHDLDRPVAREVDAVRA